MASEDYQAHLRAVPLFASCTKRQLEEIGRVADEIRLPAGKVLAQQGDIGFDLMILVAGIAEVTRDGIVVGEVGSGHFIGEMAVLSKRPRNATLTAKTDVDVLVLTRSHLDQLLDDIPGFAKQLLYEIVARVANNEPTDR
jgi:CRP/FNR family transcriptional regulator, cyclic AMP receptor protein